MNYSSNETEFVEAVNFFRHSAELTAIYTFCYGVVFIVGLLGNVFVVLAVVSHAQLRSTTDYLISSLAFADLLILLFCLPTTLLNNILTEWQLGAVICKVSTWANCTTSVASIYTLVAVTADRFMAICHTMKYTLWETKYTIHGICAIWVVSAMFGAPQFFNYHMVVWEDAGLTIKLCMPRSDQKLYFLCVNLLLAFIVPFLLISISYTKIFITVTTHRSLAVDAQRRDERVKLRVATMMLTVIVIFAICWFPLYMIFTYFYFFSDQTSELFSITSNVIRPIFQWLSLLSSALNPLIYIAYSHKYRRAFLTIILMPCRNRYERVRGTILRKNGRLIQKDIQLRRDLSTEVINGQSSVYVEVKTVTPQSHKKTLNNEF